MTCIPRSLPSSHWKFAVSNGSPSMRIGEMHRLGASVRSPRRSRCAAWRMCAFSHMTCTPGSSASLPWIWRRTTACVYRSARQKLQIDLPIPACQPRAMQETLLFRSDMRGHDTLPSFRSSGHDTLTSSGALDTTVVYSSLGCNRLYGPN
jgi:hypothetical protein